MKKIGIYLAERLIISLPIILLILVSLSIVQHWFRYLLGFFITCSIIDLLFVLQDWLYFHKQKQRVRIQRKSE